MNTKKPRRSPREILVERKCGQCGNPHDGDKTFVNNVGILVVKEIKRSINLCLSCEDNFKSNNRRAVIIPWATAEDILPELGIDLNGGETIIATPPAPPATLESVVPPAAPPVTVAVKSALLNPRRQFWAPIILGQASGRDVPGIKQEGPYRCVVASCNLVSKDRSETFEDSEEIKHTRFFAFTVQVTREDDQVVHRECVVCHIHKSYVLGVAEELVREGSLKEPLEIRPLLEAVWFLENEPSVAPSAPADSSGNATTAAAPVSDMRPESVPAGGSVAVVVPTPPSVVGGFILSPVVLPPVVTSASPGTNGTHRQRVTVLLPSGEPTEVVCSALRRVGDVKGDPRAYNPLNIKPAELTTHEAFQAAIGQVNTARNEWGLRFHLSGGLGEVLAVSPDERRQAAKSASHCPLHSEGERHYRRLLGELFRRQKDLPVVAKCSAATTLGYVSEGDPRDFPRFEELDSDDLTTTDQVWGKIGEVSAIRRRLLEAHANLILMPGVELGQAIKEQRQKVSQDGNLCPLHGEGVSYFNTVLSELFDRGRELDPDFGQQTKSHVEETDDGAPTFTCPKCQRKVRRLFDNVRGDSKICGRCQKRLHNEATRIRREARAAERSESDRQNMPKGSGGGGGKAQRGVSSKLKKNRPQQQGQRGRR